MKHLGTKTIETERLILRRFAVEDAEQMYENWASDAEVTKFLMWPTHTDVEATRKLLGSWVDAYEKEDKYEWCIVLKEKNEPIGSIGAVGLNEKVKSAEVGYCIGRAYWHKGYTSEALSAVMKFLLEEVGVERIEARHDPKNPHSGDVMKKCGLRYEGTRIRADWNNSGICDTALYGYVKGVTDAAEESDGACAACCAEAETRGQAAAAEADITGQHPAAEADVTGQHSAANKESSAKRQPKHQISDETIEYVGILAKLELDDVQREQAKQDMGEMLDYIDKLNELDTDGVEPMTHIFPVSNVFREDVVTNGDGAAATLLNAPEQKDGGFKVPRTIG